MRTFTILEFSGKQWAMDFSHLREVVEQLPCTPIPLASATFRGVINLRGDLVPVLALDAWLSLGTTDTALARRPWMAILDVGRNYFGILADRVNTITFEGELEDPPQGMGSFLEGIAQTTAGTLLVIRPASLIRHLEQGLKLDHLLPSAQIAA
jgi:chemotaxis signal transduction protein